MSGADLLLIPPALLLAGGLWFRPWSRGGGRETLITGLALLHLLAAVGLLSLSLSGAQNLRIQAGELAAGLPVLSIHLDATAAVMLTLVAFVGWSISRYSIRYLDGEVGSDRYWRWLGVTVGAVSLLAVSGGLLTLLLAWGLSSLGIHQLLTYYANRPAAQRAAWVKFGFSRLGDVFLLSAAVLLYREFGTLEFDRLFAAARQYGESGLPVASILPMAGGLLIAGAAVKTVQFPFHTWLPETLEAPTPVSALMHAGIVNAGGYFLIRVSPLLGWSPVPLTVLGIVGALTACFAAVVMLTQTSIKRSLAWSTVAQMGFMMLQCGLGAFSAAMLHLVAHSLYKAHAFLNSGDVLNQVAATRGAATRQPDSLRRELVRLGLLTVASMAVFAGVASLWQLDPASKPGGFLLGLILCLGLARWSWLAGLMRNRLATPMAIAATALLSVLYVAGFSAMDAIVSGDLASMNSRPVAGTAVGVAAVAFLSMFLLEAWLSLQAAPGGKSTPRWLQAAYVHASNGFYVDAIFAYAARPFTTREPRHYAGVTVNVGCHVTRKETV